MKATKYTFIRIILCVLVWVTPAYAQYTDIVSFSSIQLEEKGDGLVIDMDIMIHTHSINSYQSLTIMPELTGKGDGNTRRMPDILINGKKKARMYNRSLKYAGKKNKNTETPSIRFDVHQKTDTILQYKYATPYEIWMDTASLTIHQIMGGCADKEKAYAFKNKAQVKTEVLLPYTPQVKVNYLTPMLEPKHRKVEETAFLDFKVGQAVILSDYRRNPEELAKIITSVRNIYGDEDITITGISLKGHASPDGSFNSNERLSLARATALRTYISQYFTLPGRLFEVTTVSEDWAGLKELVLDGALPDREAILEIIDKPDHPDKKEQQLKKLSSYKTLYNDYFPQLRRVAYRINYTVRDYTIEETEILLQKNPAYLSPYEIYKVAEKYSKDSNEWYELMQQTVWLYPDDIVALINATASSLERGKYEEAESYIQKLEDEPRAFNNIGAYYLLTGEPEKAEMYLRRAQGIEGAMHNLMELRTVKEDIEKRNKRGK